jgi:hypothetical protein
MVGFMALRTAVRALLAIIVLAGGAVPAAAAPWGHGVPRVTITAEGPGTLIALRYGAAHVHFVHTREALERVALADIDRDGHVDIVAAPRDGALMVWRNAGHGRFARIMLPRSTHRVVAREPRMTRLDKTDDGWQWGDERHDAALTRAPDVIGDVPVAAVRVTTPVYVRPVSFRRFSGRAPPVL